jgi:hypothetical protein
VGPNNAAGIKSDAFITVAAKAKDGRSEVICFGGTELSVGDLKIARTIPDLFAETEGNEVRIRPAD